MDEFAVQPQSKGQKVLRAIPRVARDALRELMPKRRTVIAALEIDRDTRQRMARLDEKMRY